MYNAIPSSAVALMIADSLAIPIKQGSATVVLADEKRLDARNNLLGMDLDDNLWIPFV